MILLRPADTRPKTKIAMMLEGHEKVLSLTPHTRTDLEQAIMSDSPFFGYFSLPTTPDDVEELVYINKSKVLFYAIALEKSDIMIAKDIPPGLKKV